MGAIRVHEFISLDSVIDAPSWTFEFGFDPRMGEAIGRVTAASDGILLGRTTYEMFEPAWSKHVDAGGRGALRQRGHLPEAHPGVVNRDVRSHQRARRDRSR